MTGLILFLLQGFPLDLQLQHLPGDFVEFSRQTVDFRPQPRGSFVDEIDRFVGKKPVGDIAVRELGGGHQCRIFDPHAVMHFVAFLQSAEDRNGILDRGLIDQHGLEAPFQRGVLLDMFAVLIERRRADQMQFAAGQHGLEQIGGIHRAFGRSGSNDRMQFIDEEQDLTLRGLNLFQDGLQAFFKLAAKFGAGDQRAHVERHELVSASALRARRL